MTDLILTEKFSVASDFAKALGATQKGNGYFKGNGVTVTWAVGHLVELYEPEDYDPSLKRWRLETLPVIPKTFSYKPIKRTYSQFKIIRDLLANSSFTRVILATDAGREGEVIARTILQEAGFKDSTRVYRFWTSQALVPDVVRRAMAQLRPMADYDRLWRAGFYRQVSDWLIGMNCTRALTVRLNDLFSVGRVQTAVLSLLVDRRKARETFVPQPYWVLTANFSNDKGNWTGRWFRGKDNQIMDRNQAQALYQRLNRLGAVGGVDALNREKKRQAPLFLFSLTDLQQEANKRYGFPATQTLNLAQKLYQDRKCLSYPRTDSKVLGSQNLQMVQTIVNKLAAVREDLFCHMDWSRLSLSNKRVFNDAKLTDHHALIPLKPIPDSAGPEERKIYDLVLRRFAAAFHPDCRFEVTRVVTLLDDQTFATRGKIIIDPGWQRVWLPIAGNQGTQDIDRLPNLTAGDPARLVKMVLKENQTTPPAEYTDSSLLKDMTHPGRYVDGEVEKKLYRGEIGIGTQSTRAQIIETLIKRNYVQRSGKRLMAMDKGVFLVETLRQCPLSSRLAAVAETARWEMGLNQIALGADQNSRFLDEIKSFTEKVVKELSQFAFDTTAYIRERKRSEASHTSLGKCPGCGKDVFETYKAYSCGDRDCGFVIWKNMSGKRISPKMAANLIHYRRSGPFDGFISKRTQKRFSASLAIVKAAGKFKVVFEFEPKKEPASAITNNGGCPVCGGEIIEGKKGFGCANWRPDQGNCRFVIWKHISGKKLTLANAKTLAAGKTTRPYVFKTIDKEKFKARMRMVDTPDGGFAIALMPESGAEGVSEAGLVSCFRPM
ncbi:MAG: hypothetical protein CSA29_01265 [Desulfobacterales bacterium]|nr:MAG: hypothetical protein CSA29_01265 [Desulfobacterales bacterium]